jgi:uncharacterized protein (TIGR02996 family)
MDIDPRLQLGVFLKEIKDHPEDNTPRFILADWLQDRGDPRGELLALDMQRHLLPEDDPRWAALWHQERQLLRRHIFDWLGPLVDSISEWTFRRGFLHIEARAQTFLTDEINDLAQSDLFQWVESLRLTEMSSQHPTRLANSPVLAVISRLDVSDNNLGNHGLERLLDAPGLVHLRELRLARDRIGASGIEVLAGCAWLNPLRRLDLAGNRLNNIAACLLVDSPHLDHLEELDVRGNNLTTGALNALRQRFGAGVRAGRL